jgi:hypothetical protein
MKVQRVYVDTSVIGGCFDPEFAPWSKGLMKDFQLGNFKPVISEVVTAEIASAPKEVKAQYAQLLYWQVEFVPLTEEAKILADTYQARRILTPKFYDDGLHIGLATVAGVDVLVSWNFKHIVHLDKIQRFNAIHQEQGYKPIQIYSPREVTNYEERS